MSSGKIYKNHTTGFAFVKGNQVAGIQGRRNTFTVPPFTIFKILPRADITCAQR